MYDGSADKSKSKQCLFADKHGFVSIYGLLLLLILLCFVSLMLQRSAAFVSSYRLQEAYDIYAIRSSAAHMEEYRKQQDETKEDASQSEDTKKDEEESEAMSWQKMYRNTLFVFEQDGCFVDVYYDVSGVHIHMQLQFDEEDGSILNCVYF